MPDSQKGWGRLEQAVEEIREQQEKAAAREEERRLADEVRNLYQQAKDMIDSHKEHMTENYEEMSKIYAQMEELRKKEEQRRFLEEWEKTFRQWADVASTAMQEIMHRSMQRSIAGVGNLEPGMGRLGHQLGSVFGSALGMAVGGKAGAQLGGAAGGFAIDALSMQVEGYNMLGARAAKTAYGGGRFVGKDFESIGTQYRTAIRDIVRDTGATADEVARLGGSLSQMGIGLLEGGKGLVQYNFALERVLNIQPGRTLKVETDLITKYGESAASVKDITHDMIGVLAEFNMEQTRTNSSMIATFAAGNTLANALDQIASAGRNSGASLEALNSMAISLVKTMVVGGGAGTVRPEQIVEGGGRIIRGLMPEVQGDAAAESKRSGIDRMLLNRTSAGRALLDRIEKEGDAVGMSQGERQRMTESLGAIHFSRPGKESRDEAVKYFASMVGGVSDVIREHGYQGAQTMLRDRGFSGTDLVMMQKMYQELAQRQAFEPGADQSKVVQEMMREKKDDPEYQAVLARFENFMEEAKNQGDASRSALDRIADTMTDMSTWFNQSYWTKGRDAIAEAFGLGNKESIWKILGEVGKSAVMDQPAEFVQRGAEAGRRYRKMRAGESGGEAGPPLTSLGSLSREELHIDSNMQNCISAEGTRSRSGIECTGD